PAAAEVFAGLCDLAKTFGIADVVGNKPTLHSRTPGAYATRLALADDEAGVLRDVAADVGGEHAGLDLDHSAVGHLVAEDGVRDDSRLSLLVGLEEAFAAFFGQLAGVAPRQEVLERQAAVVNQRENHGIGDDSPKLLHQIESERGLAMTACMVKPEVRIK